MKKLLLLLIIPFLSFGQMPQTADSVYWSTKYCDTANTYEEYLTQWTWNGNVGDCIQPPQGMVDAFYSEENSTISLMLLDSYECCCQQASLPGSETALTFFMGSPCQTYLDSIGFIYDDPEYINWTSIDEQVMIKKLIKAINLLGQKNNNKGFQLHIYDDGSVEKKYLIK